MPIFRPITAIFAARRGRPDKVLCIPPPRLAASQIHIAVGDRTVGRVATGGDAAEHSELHKASPLNPADVAAGIPVRSPKGDTLLLETTVPARQMSVSGMAPGRRLIMTPSTPMRAYVTVAGASMSGGTGVGIGVPAGVTNTCNTMVLWFRETGNCTRARACNEPLMRALNRSAGMAGGSGERTNGYGAKGTVPSASMVSRRSALTLCAGTATAAAVPRVLKRARRLIDLLCIEFSPFFLQISIFQAAHFESRG
jgi:hypothetical protein